MASNLTKNSELNTFFLIVLLSLALSLLLTAVNAIPSGPDVTVLGNSTKNVAAATKINSTNGTSTPGGFIFTISLNSLQQNTRWKGYVGNVTGTLTLDDANDNTLFQWSLSTITGEVYATRASSSINWSGINCTWVADGNIDAADGATSNRTPEHNENVALSHTSRDDNVTKTFQYRNHSQITVGGIVIGKNECYSIQTWQNDDDQAFSNSDDANFTEVILYDGALNSMTGNVVYQTNIEDNLQGYRNTGTNETYDFQMIVPENGAPGFSSSTAYYFYVELS